MQSYEPSQSKMNEVMTARVACLANCNARNSVDAQKPCDNSWWLRPAKLPQHALKAGSQTICQHFHKNTVICHLYSPWQHQVTLGWRMYGSVCLVQPGCLVEKGALWTYPPACITSKSKSLTKLQLCHTGIHLCRVWPNHMTWTEYMYSHTK